MICGGADEIHPSTIGVFDVLYAASRRYNDRPNMTPRPFDRERDGLVIGEGAAAVILEDYEHAIARGAEIYGEILGYATNCDAAHMTQPSTQAMLDCMCQAIENAGCKAKDLDYINAHATGTDLGDKAEAKAIRQLVVRQCQSAAQGLYGPYAGRVRRNGGHLLPVDDRDGFIFPTLNLDHVDPECLGIHHVTQLTKARPQKVLSSNFAFGGVNASIILGSAMKNADDTVKHSCFLSRIIRIGRITVVVFLALLVLGWFASLLIDRLCCAAPPRIDPQQPILSEHLYKDANDCTHIGKCYIRRKDGILRMYLNGQPFALGYCNAVLSQDLIKQQETAFLETIKRLVPSRINLWLLEKYVLLRNRTLPSFVAKDYQIEIYGISQGYKDPFSEIGPSYHRILNYHAAHDISHMVMDSPLVGCTSFAAYGHATVNGHMLLAQFRF